MNISAKINNTNMEQFSKEKREIASKDITAEFEQMDAMEFQDFLRNLRKEPVLSIITDWKDVWKARRLKAFLESIEPGQKRTATIRATKEQHDQEMNVFASGVKWIKIE